MPFPSTLSTFNRPSTTSRLNSPSHSALHNDVSSAVGQIEAVIGRDGDNSVAGTLIYQIRSADSDGGGHVQVANKGGTGQTTYIKGDMLVATSTSVISKLAVGVDGYIMKADSSVAAGVKWAENVTPKVSILSTPSIISTNALEVSIMSVTLPGSILGTNNAVRATIYVGQYGNAGNSASVLIRANYGSNALASVMLRASNVATTSVMGKVEIIVMGDGATNAQRGILMVNLSQNRQNPVQNSVLGVNMYTTGTASIQSTGNATLGATIRISVADGPDLWQTDGYIVEKIV